jgi:hypothetical protein
MLKHYRYADPFSGGHRVDIISWFVKKVRSMLERILLPADDIL